MRRKVLGDWRAQTLYCNVQNSVAGATEEAAAFDSQRRGFREGTARVGIARVRQERRSRQRRQSLTSHRYMIVALASARRDSCL
jgi:hypothetical protein